ncbi:hypothetical protein CYMTET_55753 [Cymbomonas tetramitiformis]|uniref:Integrase zinc-binding domain-containing protein n=1 Tax=Cymbomonas tetramitiformis TaxID=36881 RepID=A0AAE0BDH3_9CHLO|nr:hypothetical protein CYMTET_55753 [Cymbomonas tetramitiformis]
MGNMYGQPPVLYSQPRLAPMPYHTPTSYDPSVGRWTSPRGLAMEAPSPSMLPTEQQRLWWIQMNRQQQTSTAPSTVLPSTSARPDNVIGQEYPHAQPDEETLVKTDNLDEHGRPLLPLKPYTSGASTDPTDAGETAVQHQKSSRRRRRSSGPHSHLKNMTSPPRSSGEGSGGGRHTSPTQAVGNHDSDGSGSGSSTSRPSSSRSHGGDLSRRQQRRRKRGTEHREREARRQAQITAKITAEQVEAMERRSREQFQMLLAEQAAANADREKESTDRLKDALSASLTANEFQRDAMGRQREALASAQAEMAQLRQELGQLIAKRSEPEQQLVEPQLHSLTEAAGRSTIDLSPRHAAPHYDSDEVSSVAVVQGSVRSMREDPANRAIVRRRDSVDSQVVHIPSNIEPVSTDRPAMRWDSSSTKYAPPQRRSGKQPVGSSTDGAGSAKDDDEADRGGDGAGDHNDDCPEPDERALPSAPRTVAPDDGVQVLVITPCRHSLWMRLRSVSSPDGEEVQHFPLTLPTAGPDNSVDGPQRAWNLLQVTAHPTLDEFRESESEQYLEDGLEAVVAVYNSRWYREILAAAAVPSQSTTSMVSHERAADPSNAMYTVDPRALKNEQYQLKDVRKLVESLPEFPSQVKSPEPLDDLEVFAKAVLKLMQHMTVRTVLSSWSCLPERSNGAVMTVADVLAMVSEDRLAKPQQQYLEESAPGGSTILKIRQVATDLEVDKVKEDAALTEVVARQVAQEMAQRQRPTLLPRSTVNPPRPFSFARRRPIVAAIQDPHGLGLQHPGQTLAGESCPPHRDPGTDLGLPSEPPSSVPPPRHPPVEDVTMGTTHGLALPDEANKVMTSASTPVHCALTTTVVVAEPRVSVEKERLPTDYRDLKLTVPGDTTVYQLSLEDQRLRLHSWKWRSPPGSTTVEALLRKLKKAAKSSSPQRMREIADSTRRLHTTRRLTTTPKSWSQRAADLKSLQRQLKPPSRTSPTNHSTSRVLLMAWDELSAREQQHAIMMAAQLSNAPICPGASALQRGGTGWKTTGLGRLRARWNAAALKVQTAYRLHRRRKADVLSLSSHPLSDSSVLQRVDAAARSLFRRQLTVIRRAFGQSPVSEPPAQGAAPVADAVLSVLHGNSESTCSTVSSMEVCCSQYRLQQHRADLPTPSEEVTSASPSTPICPADSVLPGKPSKARRRREERARSRLTTPPLWIEDSVNDVYPCSSSQKSGVGLLSGGSLDFTQQMAAGIKSPMNSPTRLSTSPSSSTDGSRMGQRRLKLRFASLRDHHPEAYPTGLLPADVDETHPTCLTLTEQLDMRLVANARRQPFPPDPLPPLPPDSSASDALQLKRHLIALETARQLGNEDSLPRWLMMATRGDSEEGAYAATADELPYPAVDHDDSGKPTTEAVKTEDPDSKDAKVSPEWRKRFEAFFKQYEEQLRASLPELSKLRSSKEDNAHVTLKSDKEGGPPCRRPYKMSVEELRQLRERIEQLMEKGRTVEEHHEHCRIFLETCKEKGVYLKASKAKLCKESLRFLGHTLSAKGCQPQHDKIESVKSWPALETVTHQQWAFEELKRALSSGPVLALPDTKAAFDGSAPFLARWYMDLVEVGVPRMEYVKGALLLVPDALSRRPDYVEKTPRQGLKDAGVVNPITDLPSDPTSVLDTNDIFEDKPPDPAPPWLAELGAWTEAVSTLQVAEAAMEQHGSLTAELAAGVTTRGKAKTVSFAGSDPPSSSPVLDAPVGGKPGRPRGRLPKDQLADRQDWKVCPEVFDRLQEQYGKFDVDACCDIGGKNRQVEQYWSDCLSELWRGKHVWCNPPYSSSHITIEAVLLKYLEEWKADPENTSAVFLLPDLQKRMPQWRSIFRRAGMQIREVIPTHDAQGVATQLYMTPDGRRHDLPWPVLVVYAPPARRQQNRVRYPRVTPPIVQTGEAARVRDQHDPPTDATFLKALREEYDRAGPLHDLRAKVLASPHRMTRDFRVVGEVLWRVAAGRYQLVLGEDSPLREVIFQEAHDSLTAGHTGREKTLERVLRRFWWKNATDDVAAWVSSCPTCQSVRPRASFPDGLLNPHAIPARNWQVVGVDFVTGLPMTTQGNDAFATFTCKLSKMVHVVPMHFGDSSAQTVARIYFDVVWRQHGAPMKIVCDRDPRFQDAFWRELMRLMGVRVASTTPYNPRSDGQAEASNRVVEDMLRSFVGANADDWDLYATNVEFAINDSRSEATGFTPFELCYGVSPMSQLDLFLEAATEPGAQRRKGGVGTAHEMAVKFSSQLRDARARLELAQQRQRAQFDQRHSQQEYQVGDLVWIEAKHLTEKLMDRKLCRKLGRRWHGPVPVVERFYSDLQAELPEAERGAPVAYRLRLPPHWLIHDVFAQHRLKPHVGGEDSFARRSVIPIPEPVMVDGQAEAYVDKILAYRVRSVRGKQVEEWKVRWVGFSSAHDQWRTRDKMNRGGENQQLKEFEEERLRRQRESMQEVAERRRRLRDAAVDTAAAAEVTLAQLIQHPCDEPEPAVSEEACLPWESLCTLDDGEVARVTEADWGDERPVRILVMFSGTGSVEKQFDKCFPHSQAVTVDHDPLWRATHVNTIEDWDYRQYPPGYFDVIWASPPCTQYSQARTTGGPPDLQSADECVQRTLDIIEYFKPEHWFLENPEGRFPNALRLRPIMDKLPEPLFCTYCKYGKRYRKPTCIWTSTPPQTPLLQCTADTPCAYKWATGGHPDTAQVGPHPDQTGARDSRAVYPIPGPLLYHLFHALQYGRLALKQDPAA